MIKTSKTLLFISFFLYVTTWVVINAFISDKSMLIFGYFTDSYGIIALLGSIGGYSAAKKWGGTKSKIGKALLGLSTGLLFQFLGQVSYAIYFYVYNVENPYPSFGEIFYFGSIPVYIYSVWQLATASGFTNSLKTLQNKMFSIVIPLAMMLISYYFFLLDYETNWENTRSTITTLLDFGYPLGQAICVSLAIVSFIFSKKTLGGIMRKYIIGILAAILIQYVADSTFLYNTISETWRPGGIDDLLFLTSYFVMGIALINFTNAYNKIKSR